MEREERIASARALMKSCRLCPRECGVDRYGGEKGFCKMGAVPFVASHGPHFGEEPPLVGTGGSGTIFLSGCNLGCLFCQNADISHGREGVRMGVRELVKVMLALQDSGCHNINFVTPTHFMPPLLEAVLAARDAGLTVPIVWNCGGYETLEAIQVLDGIVDIYMPDIKYASENVAIELSTATGYWTAVKDAVKEMHYQVGDLEIDDNGVATRGLLVRHLVMPNGLAGTRQVSRFLAKEVSPNTYTNIMDQYRPCYNASTHPKINRATTSAEYDEAVQIARDEGLWRGF